MNVADAEYNLDLALTSWKRARVNYRKLCIKLDQASVEWDRSWEAYNLAQDEYENAYDDDLAEDEHEKAQIEQEYTEDCIPYLGWGIR